MGLQVKIDVNRMRERCDELGITIAKLSRNARVSRPTIYSFFNEEPISDTSEKKILNALLKVGALNESDLEGASLSPRSPSEEGVVGVLELEDELARLQKEFLRSVTKVRTLTELAMDDVRPFKERVSAMKKLKYRWAQLSMEMDVFLETTE